MLGPWMLDAAPLQAANATVSLPLPAVLLYSASVGALCLVVWRHQRAIELLQRGDEPEVATPVADAPKLFGGALYDEPSSSTLADLMASVRTQPLRAAIAVAALLGFAAAGVLLQSSSAASAASAALAAEASALRATNDSLLKALAAANAAAAATPATGPASEPTATGASPATARSGGPVDRPATRRAATSPRKLPAPAPVLPPAPVLTGTLP